MTATAGVREVEVAVHTALVVLHVVAVVWHASRRRWLHAGVHAGAALYDAWATARHVDA